MNSNAFSSVTWGAGDRSELQHLPDIWDSQAFSVVLSILLETWELTPVLILVCRWVLWSSESSRVYRKAFSTEWRLRVQTCSLSQICWLAEQTINPLGCHRSYCAMSLGSGHIGLSPENTIKTWENKSTEVQQAYLRKCKHWIQRERLPNRNRCVLIKEGTPWPPCSLFSMFIHKHTYTFTYMRVHTHTDTYTTNHATKKPR